MREKKTCWLLQSQEHDMTSSTQEKEDERNRVHEKRGHKWCPPPPSSLLSLLSLYSLDGGCILLAFISLVFFLFLFLSLLYQLQETLCSRTGNKKLRHFQMKWIERVGSLSLSVLLSFLSPSLSHRLFILRQSFYGCFIHSLLFLLCFVVFSSFGSGSAAIFSDREEESNREANDKLNLQRRDTTTKKSLGTLRWRREG